jgi:hypothetical protein
VKTPTVVLVCGYARAGKDTFGAAFQDLVVGSRKVAFADSLKAASNLFLERLGLHAKADLTTEQDRSRFRDFLVAGGRMARSIEPGVFADIAARQAYLNLLAGRCVVMTDWRYRNELEAVRTICAPYKVVTVRVRREETGPANDEEAWSIREIEDLCHIDHDATFRHGETGLIRDLALTVAASIPDTVAA